MAAAALSILPDIGRPQLIWKMITQGNPTSPLVGLAPGIPGGRPGQAFRPDQIYLPTWIEWGVLPGIASFAAALVTLGVRRLVAPSQ